MRAAQNLERFNLAIPHDHWARVDQTDNTTPATTPDPAPTHPALGPTITDQQPHINVDFGD